LALFGEFYRDVLATPEGDDHQNIRNFMKTGWAGVQFNTTPLTEKK
jgi:HopJ type III effector protein.